MWLIEGTPALLTDLYELTMAQVYFKKRMTETAHFEVTVRRLPEDWGFFVMAGLAEVASYLERFRFSERDLEYLRSTGLFDPDFVESLADFTPDVTVRALPEGTVFFPNEPILEIGGPILDAQLLESYLLNILGFSIIEATLATRTVIAARGVPVADFGLRRCQGPVASMRAARGGQIAGFAGTSNVFAARAFDFAPSGTMAHSYVQACDSEEQAFWDYCEQFGSRAILLVDTYDTKEGIRIASDVARRFLDKTGTEITGVRIDSGDLSMQAAFARDYFHEHNIDFMKVFVSGDLDEYKIDDLLAKGAPIDGIGIGTRYSAARHAPAIEIVYKIVQYDERGLFKTSPDKHTRPGRKTILRTANLKFEKDIVCPLDPDANDLLRPFTSAEPIETIRERLRSQIASLPAPVTSIRHPQTYPVDFASFPAT